MSTKPTEALLSPYTLGDLQLKNRIVMAPLTRTRADNQGKVPTELIAEVGSSRVDLQACKLEYSIVSPK